MKLPPGFDLHSIEVFMLTAELGGMTQSAQHLGMTQSAVSQTISKLEATLAVRLFDRTMRPLALTPAGKLLLRDGSRLLTAAKGLVREVQEGSEQPAECVTIAMAESLANHLTAPLLQEMGGRAARWRIRSGISLLQHHEFMARKIDMMITGSSQVEEVAGVVHFAIMEESFVVIAPAGHPAAGGPLEALQKLPFVRYSLLSAMGQRIERQIARLQIKPPNTVEVDSTMQQLSLVAAGVGWSITTPLCLAGHLDLVPEIHVSPMQRGAFRRKIQLVARRGEFGDLPQDIAGLSARLLEQGKLRRLADALPWLPEVLGWPGDGTA